MPNLLAVVLSTALALQSPRGTAEIAFDGVEMSIDYGRPALKGRDLMGSLPVGYVWRLGADAATTFQTSHDLKFNDVKIPAGSYSLFLKRTSEQSWELVFNTETGQWGTQQDVTLDVARVATEWTRQDDVIETLTIQLSRRDGGGELEIRWGKDVVSVSFRTYLAG